jgi:hypothetical protein
MGGSTSKNDYIDDFSRVDIPINHTHLKILNLSANLKKGLSLKKSVVALVKYIFNEPDNKKKDIIVIQGLHDKHAVSEFINEFITVNNNENRSFIITPEFDEYDIDISNNTNISIEKSFDVSWNNESSSNSHKISKIHSNIIISRLPIISSFNISLNENTGSSTDDLIKKEILLGVNLKLGDKIFTIYNFVLSPDMLYVDTNKVRETQLNKLISAIEQNNIKYESQFSILCAKFNIPLLKKNETNKEYTDLLHKYALYDLSINDYQQNISNRLNYIMLYINDIDFKDRQIKEIQKLIREKYGITVLQSKFFSDIDVSDTTSSIIHLLIKN